MLQVCAPHASFAEMVTVSTRALVGALGLAAAARVASAEPEADPAVTDAASANLAPTGRHGIVVSATIAPGAFIGFGQRGDSGLSGMFSLRLGKVASSTTIMYAELQGGGLVHQPGADPSMPSAPKPAATSNNLGALLVGALHYVAPSLWLRIGFGFGDYSRNQEQVDGILIAHEALGGVIGNVGIGLDLVRWRYAALGLEASSSTLIHHGGMTTMSGLGLGLTF